MVYIKKSHSPQILIEKKKEVSQGKTFEKVISELVENEKDIDFYDAIADKNPIRAALVAEQNCLCAYCMGKIEAGRTKMKIEHFKSQKNYPQFQLDYDNMLGCCLGNEGKPKKQQNCDTYKGNKELSLNPSVKNDFEKMKIIYFEDGKISSGNDKFRKEIETVLNLNNAFLVGKRKEMIISAQVQLNKDKNPRKKQTIQRLIQQYLNEKKPYYGAAVYYLEKKLKNAK